MTKGYRIRAKREELGISQTDLAKSIGVSKQTLYKYEHDIVTNIPSNIVERMSHALNCSPGYIMGWGNQFRDEDALIVAKVRTDTEITEALKIYFSLPQEKKKYIVDFIKMIGNQN